MARNNIDITKVGPQGFAEIQRLNNEQFGETEELDEYLQLNLIPIPSQFDYRRHLTEDVASPLSTSNTMWGQSRYDLGEANEYEFQHLGDIRAENQSAWAKIGAGIAKGAVLAGTTFLDGTVGLVVGGVEAVAEGDISKFWNNEVSVCLQSINEAAEADWLPNYYTQAELNDPWYQHILSANFIGDKFLKNLGFTIGAAYSGAVWAKPLTAGGKLAATIAKVSETSRAPKIVAESVGSFISAVNEGRIEALNNSSEWARALYANLDSRRNQDLEALRDYDGSARQASDMAAIQADYERDLAALQTEFENLPDELVRDGEGRVTNAKQERYNQALEILNSRYQQRVANEATASGKRNLINQAYRAASDRIEEDRFHVGNVDWALNLPILYFSNLTQFASLYSGGYKTARRTARTVNRTIQEGAEGAALISYDVAERTFATKLGAGLKNAASEGAEEGFQGLASTIPGIYYESDVNNFYSARTDPRAEQETMSWYSATTRGIAETILNPGTWEEVFIGSLTGAIGVPRFLSAKNALGKFQSPVVLEGGILGEWRDQNRMAAREAEVVNYLNQRVQDPEFVAYYQGLVRHNKFLNDMNLATEDGNAFDFKNAEHAQLISDIVMFDSAGRLEDLYQMINEAAGTTDADLDAIIRNTTSINNGKLAGPFAQYAALDSDGNIVSVFGSDQQKQEMISKLEDNKKRVTDTIKQYRTIKERLEIETGENLTDAQLEELTFMTSQMDNWKERAKQLYGELSPILNHVSSILENLLLNDVINQELSLDSDVSLLNAKAEAIRNTINTLRLLAGVSQDDIVNLLGIGDNSAALEAVLDYIDLMNKLGRAPLSAELQSVISLARDLVKIADANVQYREKFREFMESPEKLGSTIAASDAIRSKESADRQQAKDISDKMNKVANTSVAEMSDMEDSELAGLADLGTDISEADEAVKAHREKLDKVKDLKTTKKAVAKAIDESDASEMVKNAAKAALAKRGSNKEVDGEDSLLDLTAEEFNDLSTVLQDNPQLLALAEQGLSLEELLKVAQTTQEAALQLLSEVIPNYRQAMEELRNMPKGKTVRTFGDEESELREVGHDSTSEGEVIKRDDTPISDERIPTPDTNSLDIENSKDPEVDKGESVPPSEYWIPVTTRLPFWRSAVENRDWRPFYEIAKGLKNADGSPKYTEALLKAMKAKYTYLEKVGAFDRVDSDKVKKGDTIGFFIDKSLNDAAGEFVVLMTVNGEVVGDLVTLNNTRDPDQIEFLKKAEEEWNSKGNPDTLTLETTSTVAKMMIGKIPYSKTEDNSLNRIAGTLDSDGNLTEGTPVLAIAVSGGKNAAIVKTPGRTAAQTRTDEEFRIHPTTAQAGQPFMLIRTSRESEPWVCVPFRMEYFNSSRPFRLTKEINKILERIATRQGDPKELKNLLKELLAVDDAFIEYTGSGSKTKVTFKIRRQKGDNWTTIYQGKPSDTTFSAIANRLNNLNIPYLVSRKYINTDYNGTPYNQMVGEIAHTNLPVATTHTQSDWFIVNPIRKGLEVKAKSPKSTYINPSSHNTTREYTKKDGSKVTVDMRTFDITDANGNPVDPEQKDQSWNKVRAVYYGIARNVNPEAESYETPWGTWYPKQKTFGTVKQDPVDIDQSDLAGDVSPDDFDFDGGLPTNDELEEAKRRLAELERVLKTPGLGKAERTVNLIATDTNELQLSEDEETYVNTKTGEVFTRVTSAISADLTSGDRIDKNNPWVTPSTTIGTGIDALIRDFFEGTIGDSETLSDRYPNATNEQLREFVKQLEELKKKIEQKGLTVVPKNVAVSGTVLVTTSQGVKNMPVAGTLDLLMYDKEGNFYIYDIKTHHGDVTADHISKWSKQTSLYKLLLEKKYGVKVKSLGIIPVKVSYPTPKGFKNGTAEYSESDGQLMVNGKEFRDAAPKLEPVIAITPSYLNLVESKLTEKEKSLIGIARPQLRPDEAPELTLVVPNEQTVKYVQDSILGDPLIGKIVAALSDEQYAILTSLSVPVVADIIDQFKVSFNVRKNRFADKIDGKSLDEYLNSFINKPTLHNTRDIFDILLGIKWKESLNGRPALTHSMVYKENGKVYITLGEDTSRRLREGNYNPIEEIRFRLRDSGIDPDSINITRVPNTNQYEVTSKDVITRERRLVHPGFSRSSKFMEDLTNHMQRLAPGLKILVIPAFKIPRDAKVPLSARAFFYKGTAYLVKERFTREIAIEECLHPIVEVLASQNPLLFDNILKEVKAMFPTLEQEIKKSYDRASQDKELVAQALSRGMVREIDEAGIGNSISNIVRKILNFIKQLFNLNNVIIGELPSSTTYDELVKLLNDSNTSLNVAVNGETVQVKSVSEMAESLKKRVRKRVNAILNSLQTETKDRVLQGLVRVASYGGVHRYFDFKNAVNTLATLLLRGYETFEAFDTVLNALYSPEERRSLFDSLKTKYPGMSDLDLEFMMVDNFRLHTLGFPVTLINTESKLFREMNSIINAVSLKAAMIDGLFTEVFNSPEVISSRDYANTTNGVFVRARLIMNRLRQGVTKQELAEFDRELKALSDSIGDISWSIATNSSGYYIAGFYRMDVTKSFYTSPYIQARDKARLKQYYTNRLQYGNLTEEEKLYLGLRGVTVEEYNKYSTEERDHLFKCM